MSDLLRVLAICHEDPEYVLGGMGTHVRELYRHMGYRGDCKIDLLSGGLGEGSRVYHSFHRHMPSRLTCWKPRAENMTSLLLQDVQLLKTFQRLLVEGHRWDVIHVHEWGALQVAWACREALQVPLVGTMHLCLTHLQQGGSTDWDHDARKLRAKIAAHADLNEQEQAQLELAWARSAAPGEELCNYMLNQEARLVVESDETILCSKAYVQLADKLFLGDGLIPKPINMIYNGIATDQWHPAAGDGARAKRHHHLPEDRPIALYCGRIADMKGIIPLLDAIEEKDPGYLVVLAGAVNASTQEEADNWVVTKRIKALQLQYPRRLRWLDYQHGQNLKDLYAAATVGLMPSIHEPFGIVALEMMAMGVPLIATEVDGLGEVVTDSKGGEYAMIVPAGRPDHILQALELLEDEGRRAELRALGIKRTQDFTWEQAAAQTVDVYKKAIGANDAS